VNLNDLIGPIAIGVVIFLANRMWKRFTAALAAQHPAAPPPPFAPPNVTAPGGSAPAVAAAPGSPQTQRPPKRLVQRPPSPAAPVQSTGAAARAAVRPPAFTTIAADAFPVLDLTLPGADGTASFGAVRKLSPIFRGAGPGSRAWGVQAIVAMEVLGPPVSLRSGATLGAPHAF
jgi:hypothetical protein